VRFYDREARNSFLARKYAKCNCRFPCCRSTWRPLNGCWLPTVGLLPFYTNSAVQNPKKTGDFMELQSMGKLPQYLGRHCVRPGTTPRSIQPRLRQLPNFSTAIGRVEFQYGESPKSAKFTNPRNSLRPIGMTRDLDSCGSACADLAAPDVWGKHDRDQVSGNMQFEGWITPCVRP
jgi:hypothetical protein